jgi:ADP-ribosylglycohydrolase
MIGAIIGDVVGSRFEFNNIKTKEFELITDRSEYTDDSVLTIAVMDILNSGDVSNENCVKTMQKWARKYPFAGYGSKFIFWKDMANPRPYNSCGNGSAMRVSAVGWFAKSEEDVIRLSGAVTKITHNHPEGLKGAEVTAMCIYKALHGASRKELREYILSKYPEVADLDYEELKRTYYHGAEICQVTVPQALYCFLISTDFEDCLRTTISIGGDCDTTSAISCAIAEAFYKKIDEKLINKVRNKLTKEMLEVIDLASRKVEEN